MTTILLTDKYLLADKLLGLWSSRPHGRMKKIILSRDGKMAISIGGTVDFKDHHKQVARAVEYFLTRYIQGKTDGSITKELRETLKDLSVLVLTRNGKYYINKTDCAFVPEGNTEAYGTGAQLATTFALFDVEPEKIIPSVARIDQYTSREFDIVYTTDLKA